MKIEMTDLINAAENGGIDNIINLKNYLDELINIYRVRKFIRVEIFNREGDVTSDIKKKFPKFNVQWHGKRSETIGTNYVFVPREMWNEDVKKELAKFDSFVGHYAEKHTDYKLRDDIDIPVHITYDLNRFASDKSGKDIHERLFSHYFLRSYGFANYIKKFFKEVEVIDREYDEDLRVYDIDRSYDNIKEAVFEL